MTKPWIILDCNYISYRAFHTTGVLNHDGQPTGVLYGFFMALKTLEARWNSDKFVFCWDDGPPTVRQNIYPEYKNSRKEYDEAEMEERNELKTQMERLKKVYLPQLGYGNIFWQAGYEADDIIASVAQTILKREERAVIVSADQDLWQLICKDIICYNPQTKNTMNHRTFFEKFHIPTGLWANVKALTGCQTDDVEGIKGIGLARAVKYYRNELEQGSRWYEQITKNLNIHNRNINLVRLPFKGTKRIELKEDKVNKERQKELYKELGMFSLLDEPPTGIKPR
jgi:DNA polymerase I